MKTGADGLAREEDEEGWLRHHILRLRTALRYAKAAETAAVLQEVIGNAEDRLEALTRGQLRSARTDGQQRPKPK